MQMLFPFSKMLSSVLVVSFPVSWSRSNSTASSRTQFTYTSKPFSTPVNSLCPLFIIIQTFSFTHLSTNSDGRRIDGFDGVVCFVGSAISLSSFLVDRKQLSSKSVLNYIYLFILLLMGKRRKLLEIIRRRRRKKFQYFDERV